MHAAVLLIDPEIISVTSGGEVDWIYQFILLEKFAKFSGLHSYYDLFSAFLKINFLLIILAMVH